MSARAAVVCALLLGAAIAHADDKRPVAVIDLAEDDPELRELADKVETALQNHPALTAVIASLGGPLHDLVPDEDGEAMRQARKARTDADAALNAFDFGKAESRARDGQEQLDNVTPTVAAPIYADLALIVGQARLSGGDGKRAGEAFALVHQLAPELQLDPTRYLPEVIEAFDKAQPPAATRPVEVQGSGRVWIDGREVGAAPGTFTVTLGAHFIQLAGPDRPTRGREETVLAADPKAASPLPVIVQIADANLAETVRLHRARLILSHAPDAIARAGAMENLATLVHVHDAILLSKNAAGAMQYETWRDETFTPPTVLGKDPVQSILDLIEPPPPPPPQKIVKYYPIPVPHDPPWWQRPKYYGPIAGAVISLIVTSIIITRDEPRTSYDGKLAGRGPNW